MDDKTKQYFQAKTLQQINDTDADYERKRDLSPNEKDATYQAKSWGI